MNYNQEQTFNNYELEDIKDIIGVDAYYQALQEFAKKELRRGEDFNNFTSDVLIEFVCNDLKLLKRFLETCDWDYYSDFEDYLKDKFFEEIKEQAIKDTEEDEDEIAPLQREFDILNR